MADATTEISTSGPGASQPRDRRNQTIQIKVSPEMRAALFYMAEKEGMTLAAYMRRLLGKHTRGVEVPEEYRTRELRPGPRITGYDRPRYL